MQPATSPGQLSLAIPPWIGAMSTSESRDTHTAQCTSPVSVVSQCKLVSGGRLWKERSEQSYGSNQVLARERLYAYKIYTTININTCISAGCLKSKRSPMLAAARHWNSPPEHVTAAPSTAVFQSSLKTIFSPFPIPPASLYSAHAVMLHCFERCNHPCYSLTYLLTYIR